MGEKLDEFLIHFNWSIFVYEPLYAHRSFFHSYKEIWLFLLLRSELIHYHVGYRSGRLLCGKLLHNVFERVFCERVYSSALYNLFGFLGLVHEWFNIPWISSNGRNYWFTCSCESCYEDRCHSIVHQTNTNVYFNLLVNFRSSMNETFVVRSSFTQLEPFSFVIYLSACGWIWH